MSGHIVVITTGGTLPMKRGPLIGGAAPSVKEADLRALLPSSGQQIVFEEFANVPSSHLKPALVAELARRVEARLQLPEVTGVVITHGTDTLEETAFFLDLVLTGPKPVVITGAQRAPTTIGYDGLANLAQAIMVAAAPAARDLGVLVVFHEHIWAAAEVQQVHAQSLAAFAAPATGPLGRVDHNQVWLWHRPLRRQSVPLVRVEEKVDVVVVTQGSDERMLRALAESGSRGIVLAALGGGRVPPWLLPPLQEIRARGTPVVVTSRTVGIVGDEYGYVGGFHDLQRLGCLFAPNLSAPKARIKLMLALGAARQPSDLAQFFRD